MGSGALTKRVRPLLSAHAFFWNLISVYANVFIGDCPRCEFCFGPVDNSRPLSRFSPKYASAPLAQVTVMLWTIFAILLVLWLLGWSFHLAGSLIHILLVVAVVVAIINLATGRRTV